MLCAGVFLQRPELLNYHSNENLVIGLSIRVGTSGLTRRSAEAKRSARAEIYSHILIHPTFRRSQRVVV